jgi:hypothetical protein
MKYVTQKDREKCAAENVDDCEKMALPAARTAQNKHKGGRSLVNTRRTQVCTGEKLIRAGSRIKIPIMQMSCGHHGQHYSPPC